MKRTQKKTRKEIFRLNKGKDIFIIEKENECILHYKKNIIATKWEDEETPRKKYIQYKGEGIEDIYQGMKPVNYFTTNGIPQHLSLIDASFPALELLSAGEYELYYPFYTWEEGLEIIDFEPNKEISFLSRALTLLSLQKRENMDKSRIDYFVKAIKNGARPVIYTLGTMEHGAKFILDGHHKAFAYEAAKVEPEMFFIRKVY
ncbi:MAG: hypothetical protein H7A25_12275 [Leptospiraceae bacterium]|nr:hypothetical protein [Leptospiraceae bacterium]MCP5500676.1 hypothetical protein [Leptospiraceae bacterium]